MRNAAPAPIASLSLLLAASLWAASAAADPVDTSRLPHPNDATEIYVSAPTSIYATPDSVAATALGTRQALEQDGWRPYLPPHAQVIKTDDQQILTFKKGHEAVTVMVTTPPGGARTANVNYVATLLATDLPFPPDASAIEYSPDQAYLACVSATPVPALRDYFVTELSALGWTLAPAAPSAKPAAADDRIARAFFVRADHQPLMMRLDRRDDGTSAAELKTVSPETLAALSQPQKPAPAAPAKAPVSAPPPAEPADPIAKQADEMAAKIMAEALADAKSPPPARKGPAEKLGVLQGAAAPIPMPETAEDIDYDGAEGKLEFNTASNVKSVAAFYRGEMKPLGWREQASVINRDTMVELEFLKDGKDVSLTIMQLGEKVNVSGDGAGLKNAAAKSAAEAAGNEPRDLEAEEQSGLPVPKDHTTSGVASTPFRHELTASVSADVASVIAFYRRELGKLDWKEQPGAEIKADAATIAFIAPDGPALLKLAATDDATSVSLVARDRAKAEKAGMAPKAGQAKLMFGNVMPAEAVFSINKQTIKVAAGAGAKGADGPTLELPPGKYKLVVKLAGRPAQSQEAIVAADETWGLLIGPGGVLPLQMY